MTPNHNFLDNQYSPYYRKKRDTIDYVGMVVDSLVVGSVVYFTGGGIFYSLIFSVFIFLSILWAHFDRYRTHPVGIAYTGEGVYLKRRNGKIKFLSWDGVAGLRVGKNAAILTKFFPIYLFGEARDSALYYFEKYGVKKNPKLEKVIYNIRMKELMEG